MSTNEPNTPDDDERSFAEEFWDNLGTGGKPLPLKELAELAAQRPITIDDIRYLLSHYRYLDICNGDASIVPGDDEPVQIRTAHTGWVIHDRGNRITAGLGRLLYGSYRVGDDDEGDGGTIIKPFGTIVQQSYDTAFEVISMAQQRGWVVAEILESHTAMQRYAWMASKTLGFNLNYAPTTYDQKSYEVISKYSSSGLLGKNLKPGKK